MKRHILLVMLILVLLGTAQGIILDVDQIYQEELNWCWAAVSQSVLRYYGYEYTQTQIAEYGTEGLDEWNWLWGESWNPTRRGIDMILYHFGRLETNVYESSLDYDQSSDNIHQRRPIFIRWEWGYDDGHFVVLKGLEGDTTYLMDPWYGPTINTFAWTQSGGGHIWTHSLEIVSSPTSTDDAIARPGALSIYPNPFHESVRIVSSLKADPQARIRIFNVKGQLVREIGSMPEQNGSPAFTWDGRDMQGKKAAAGIYLGFIKGESATKPVKIVKLP